MGDDSGDDSSDDSKPGVVKGIDGDCLTFRGVEAGEGSYEGCMMFCEEDSDCIGIQTDSNFRSNCELVNKDSRPVTSCGSGNFEFYPKGDMGDDSGDDSSDDSKPGVVKGIDGDCLTFRGVEAGEG